MSSFKRRATAAPSSLPPGTKPALSAPSVAITSSGIPSLDDVLGGGLPLGALVVVLTPDLHSAWGTLIQRYFISQGLSGSQAVCVVAHDAKTLVDGSMWLAGSASTKSDTDAPATSSDETIKIAWRYEKMRQFQTTVPSSSSNDFCDTFDLTIRIPESVVNNAIETGQLSSIDVDQGEDRFQTILERLKMVVKEGNFSRESTPSRKALRLAIPDLGNPYWGDAHPSDILRFLFSIRLLIRSTNIAALVTLAPHLSATLPDAWIEKIGFLSDACLSFSSFGADPSLAALFKTYHGALHIIRSPSTHSLLPSSLKHSLLRSGTAENNLAFKCTRKRFVIETLHLDVEGGVGERRTSAPPSAHQDPSEHTHHHTQPTKDAGAATVQLETPTEPAVSRPKKERKKVAFHSDRPDLYDF